MLFRSVDAWIAAVTAAGQTELSPIAHSTGVAIGAEINEVMRVRTSTRIRKKPCVLFLFFILLPLLVLSPVSAERLARRAWGSRLICAIGVLKMRVKFISSSQKEPRITYYADGEMPFLRTYNNVPINPGLSFKF